MAYQFEVGHRSRLIPRARSSAHSSGSSMVPGPWAMRSGSTARARRPAPRRPTPRHASSGAGWRERSYARAWSSGSGNAGLGTGQVPAGQALVDEPGRGLGQLHVALRVVRAQCRRDEPHDRAGPGGPARAPAHTAAMPSARERPRDTCRRGPQRISTYRTPSAAFVSTSSSVMRSRASASCRRDRQVEGAEQLGLVRAGHRGDQGGRHAGPVLRGIDSACAQAPWPYPPAASRRGAGATRPSAWPR